MGQFSFGEVRPEAERKLGGNRFDLVFENKNKKQLSYQG
jgi:hypothetical protein